MSIRQRLLKIRVMLSNDSDGATELGLELDDLLLAFIILVARINQDSNKKHRRNDNRKKYGLTLAKCSAFWLVGVILTNMNRPTRTFAMRHFIFIIDPGGAASREALIRTHTSLIVVQIGLSLIILKRNTPIFIFREEITTNSGSLFFLGDAALRITFAIILSLIHI